MAITNPKYKIRSAGGVEDILHLESKISIPHDSNNRYYQQFIRDVKEQGIGIVEGPDIVTPDYKDSRLSDYPDIGEQLDALYHAIDADSDLKGKFSTFHTAVKKIKDKYPKP